MMQHNTLRQTLLIKQHMPHPCTCNELQATLSSHAPRIHLYFSTRHASRAPATITTLTTSPLQLITTVLQPLARRAHNGVHATPLGTNSPAVSLDPDPASLPLDAAADEELVGRCEQAVAAWVQTARDAVYARQASVPEGNGCVPLLTHSRLHATTLRVLADALATPAATKTLHLVHQHSHDTALVQTAQVCRACIYLVTNRCRLRRRCAACSKPPSMRRMTCAS